MQSKNNISAVVNSRHMLSIGNRLYDKTCQQIDLSKFNRHQQQLKFQSHCVSATERSDLESKCKAEKYKRIEHKICFTWQFSRLLLLNFYHVIVISSQYL